MAKGGPVTALRQLEQALALAQQHARAGRLSAAAATCRTMLRARADWPPALHLQSFLVAQSGDYPGAVKLLRRAIAADPGNARYHNDLGSFYRTIGQLDSARGLFAQAIALDPRDGGFYYNLAEVTTLTADDPHLAAMEQLAGAAASLPVHSATCLHFALAKAYRDLGRHDDSFAHLARGNALKRRHVAWDEAEAFRRFDRLRAVFDRALFAGKAGSGFSSEVPVFIIGMPRCGSTLVEQILASHPAVHGAGEVRDLGALADRLRGADGAEVFPEAMRSASPEQLTDLGKAYVAGLRGRGRGAARIIDKDLSNFYFLGLVRLALPEARIIHVTRDPIDTCFSCYATLFELGQHFTYDLGELGRYYHGYAAMMTYWREVLPPGGMLEVRYEALVGDPEAEARRLVAFCGLPWDARCLAFHRTQRPVATASAAQVRQPIFQTSRGRSAAYRAHLGPLIAALGDLAPDSAH
jgi:tetratricopeptide (TPR) repeat protein